MAERPPHRFQGRNAVATTSTEPALRMMTDAPGRASSPLLVTWSEVDDGLDVGSTTLEFIGSVVTRAPGVFLAVDGAGHGVGEFLTKAEARTRLTALAHADGSVARTRSSGAQRGSIRSRQLGRRPVLLGAWDGDRSRSSIDQRAVAC